MAFTTCQITYPSDTEQHELPIKPLQPGNPAKVLLKSVSVSLSLSHTHTLMHISNLAAIPSFFMLLSFLANNLFSLLTTIWPSSYFSSTFAVIQDVDNASLEGQYQSFASLMEQRLAELFVLAGQQGTRFRRATAVGSYTVQVRDWHGSPQGGLQEQAASNAQG